MVIMAMSKAETWERLTGSGRVKGEMPSPESWDLRGINFSGTILAGLNLSEADLRGADLSGAYLRDALLWKADLRGANLIKANLIDAYLSGANLSKANLSGANLSGALINDATLRKAVLNGAILIEADRRISDLTGADLRAILREANLRRTILTGADLRGAILSGADLRETILTEADLSGADLSGATLISTNLEMTNLSGCRVHGISAWDLKIDKDTNQLNLLITPQNEPTITVDNIEVAQFIYLLLNRKKLRNFIDTITSKAVLILGRFTPDRKTILDAVANELRNHNLLPIIFDFERARSKDFTETIKTLAGMSFFVIADITNPKSAPLELQATVPDYQIPFVPIIQKGEEPFSMFSGLKTKYTWVIDPFYYESSVDLIKVFKRAIIDVAFEKHEELLRLKAEKIQIRNSDDYLEESN